MKKNKNYSAKEYPFLLSYDPQDKMYVAKVFDLKGCHSHGKTTKEAVKNVLEAIAGWIETAKKNDLPIPKPSSSLIEKTKKFLLRLEAENLSKLQTLATLKNKSINTLINEAVAAF